MNALACGLCDGSGSTEKFCFRFVDLLRSREMRAIPLDYSGPCPGCDGEGESVRSRREKAKRPRAVDPAPKATKIP